MSKLYPIGIVLPYSGPISPENENNLISAGYMPCDGRALSISDPQYAALYKQISSFYGADDKTFCVPDYRGRFMRGTDNGAGRDPDANTRTAPTSMQYPGNTGDNVGSLQTGGIQSHAHNYPSKGGDYWHNNYGGAETPGVFTQNDTTPAASSASGGVETRHKNAYINAVIVFM
jgi:microcystin-dependent protein